MVRQVQYVPTYCITLAKSNQCVFSFLAKKKPAFITDQPTYETDRRPYRPRKYCFQPHKDEDARVDTHLTTTEEMLRLIGALKAVVNMVYLEHIEKKDYDSGKREINQRNKSTVKWRKFIDALWFK